MRTQDLPEAPPNDWAEQVMSFWFEELRPPDWFKRDAQSATAYEADAQALALAKHAVATGMDRSLNEQQRYFLYMPFMHSEDRAVQAEAVRLFTALGSAEGAKWAEHHRGIVERFGRFPHRNALLGRQSTPEEREFLKQEPSFA